MNQQVAYLNQLKQTMELYQFMVKLCWLKTLLDAQVSEKRTSGSENVLASTNQEKSTYKSLSHLKKPEVSTIDTSEVIKGRMYDFNNGRFLSVDPFIQGVTSQAINPYSYIHNNPLSGTDPTGYIFKQFLENQGFSDEEISDRLNSAGDQVVSNIANSDAAKAVGTVVAVAVVVDQVSDYLAPVKGIVKNGLKKLGSSVLKLGGRAKTKKPVSNGKDSAPSKTNSSSDVSDIKSQDKVTRAGQNGVEGPVNQKVSRAGNEGQKGPRIKKEYPDGSKEDITRQNVKEIVPNSRAPKGESRVKFDKKDRTDTHKSDPKKRKPTTKELKELDKVDKNE